MRLVCASSSRPCRSPIPRSEKSLYVFDLSIKIMDPIIVYDSADAKFTALSFAPKGDVLLMGDSSGVVTVSLLENLHAQPLHQPPSRLRSILVAQMQQQLQEAKPVLPKKQSHGA